MLTAPFLLQGDPGQESREVLQGSGMQLPLCTARGSRRSLSQRWLPRALDKSSVPAGGRSDGSLCCFQHPRGSREQGKERVSHPTGGRDFLQEGGIRERSFQVPSSLHAIWRGIVSVVSSSAFNSCFPFLHGLPPRPILSLPLFYHPSLFSSTSFSFLSFSCCLLLHKLPFISHLFLSLLTFN